MIMYKATYKLKELGCFPTLKEAIKCIWDKVHSDIANNVQISWMELDTCTWIIGPKFQMFGFCQIKDYAYEQGFVKDSQWV